MSRFVDECSKEWSRLGVPQAAASEMAADLEADLTEAQADGVSPEEVLGNGYFDAKSFAASWAQARGVTHERAGWPLTQFRTRTLMLAVSSLVGLGAGAVGLLILLGGRMGSMSVAASALRRTAPRPVPGIFVGPDRFVFGGSGAPIALVGLILVVVGLVGAGVALFLWKPWRPRAPEFERNMGMPTYL